MVRDIRMAGLNPRGVGGFVIQEATAIKIRFASDSDWTNWDSDNDLPADDEIITYEYSMVDADCDNNAPCLRRGIGSSGSESWQVLIENVDAVNGVDFQYLDAGDNPLTLPVSALDLPNIRTVVVSLVAQDTNAEGQTFNRTLRARIRCRNL
jgi:hypothetical protein